MADGCHIEKSKKNCDIVKTFDLFWQNLEKWCISALAPGSLIWKQLESKQSLGVPSGIGTAHWSHGVKLWRHP